MDINTGASLLILQLISKYTCLPVPTFPFFYVAFLVQPPQRYLPTPGPGRVSALGPSACLPFSVNSQGNFILK